MRCTNGIHSCVYVTFIVSASDCGMNVWICFFFQAEDGIRDLVRSRGLGDVYKRQRYIRRHHPGIDRVSGKDRLALLAYLLQAEPVPELSLIHI